MYLQFAKKRLNFDGRQTIKRAINPKVMLFCVFKIQIILIIHLLFFVCFENTGLIHSDVSGLKVVFGDGKVKQKQLAKFLIPTTHTHTLIKFP